MSRSASADESVEFWRATRICGCAPVKAAHGSSEHTLGPPLRSVWTERDGHFLTTRMRKKRSLSCESHRGRELLPHFIRHDDMAAIRERMGREFSPRSTRHLYTLLVSQSRADPTPDDRDALPEVADDLGEVFAALAWRLAFSPQTVADSRQAAGGTRQPPGGCFTAEQADSSTEAGCRSAAPPAPT